MAENDSEYTLGELRRAIESIHFAIQELKTSFVRTDLWEEQRKGQGERLGEIEKDILDNRLELQATNSKISALEKVQENRFRANVAMAITGLLLPIISGAAVFLVISLLDSRTLGG